MMDVRFVFPWSQMPLWLGGMAVFLVAAWFALHRLEKRRGGRLHKFVEAGLAPRLMPGFDSTIRRPLFWLTLLGCAGLALSLMQPRWGMALLETKQASRDIIMLLDTSESMNAKMPAPSRLERAHQKIIELLEACPGDRFALIAFSGGAAVQCPLSLDHAYFRTVLRSVNTNTLSEEGTDITSAFSEALQVFKDQEEQDGGVNPDANAIFLVSDGEQVSGDALKMIPELKKYARLYVMGIGDPEGTEIQFPQSLKQFVRTNVPSHLSKLDEMTLSKLATQGGGAYVRSTPGNQDIEYIHQEMEALMGEAASGQLRFNMVNRYRWPLLLAFICFLGEGLWLAAMPWVTQWRRKRALLQEVAENV